MRSPYGKRGGTSATAGKRSAVYRWTYPDGTPGERRTFATDAPRAVAVCYQHAGKWYVAAVYPSRDDWRGSPNHTFIDCDRVDQ